MSSIFKLVFLPVLVLLFFTACKNHVNISEKEVVQKPEDINAKAEELIQGTLRDILTNNTSLSDSFKIKNAAIVESLYNQNSFHPLWSSEGSFKTIADSLFRFIKDSKEYGLFPDDYYYSRLVKLRNQLSDTSANEKKLDASLWAYNDMLLSSAFVQIIKDVKVGRLLPDSVIAKDSSLSANFFLEQLKVFQQSATKDFVQPLEPRNADYKKLKKALQIFLDKANFKNFTFIDARDSAQLPALLYKRLNEEDSTLPAIVLPDSVEVANAIKKYQKKENIKADGKLSASLIARLNNTDNEKFIRIAINLDRYKQLQALPVQYIWVNIPGYYLQLRDSDSVVLQSKVVVGKPLTPTPDITSAISNMITYPQWHIPESIIKKDILPGLKKDPFYTIRKGFSLIDEKGNEVDPTKVDWSKFKKMIPYKVIQGSGDDNALGILKFNFPNKFSVYLHDTNQRYLFSRSVRALSHGCVRVQAWNRLAQYILRNDSTYSVNAIPVDSLKNWLNTKQKKYIPVRKPIPLFIRYFTCDVKNDHVLFYDDIYGEDKRIRETIFANKQLL